MFGFSTTITLDLFLVSLYETFYMVGVSLFFGMIIGTIIAIALVIYRPVGIKP